MNKTAWLALALALFLPAPGPAPEALAGRPASPGSVGSADVLASLLRANAFLEADELAAGLLKDPALDARTTALCGLAALCAGRVREAEAVFDKVLASEPDNPEAHLGLGRIGMIRNAPEEALAHLRRAVASDAFYKEALRWLWRTAWEIGDVAELKKLKNMTMERFGHELDLPPSWLLNAWGQIQGRGAGRLFEMEGRFERLTVPLLQPQDPARRIPMLAIKLNGRGESPFDLDSASADFLTVSPLLAEELGLALTGSSSATGVGTAAAPVRFSILDRVEFGGIAFRNVPVMVSAIHPFRGRKKGLLGTALLKRFNVTIDVEADVMDFYPLERPDLLAARIDRSAVAADVPLLIYDATTVEAAPKGAPPALYFLDSAAATHLIDAPFFLKHLKPTLDPALITPGGIQGAQGVQTVNYIRGLTIGLGPLEFPDQMMCEFPMAALNELCGRYTAGLLGNPILWPYRVHMDFKNGRLILEKFRRP
jgi:hypothetical protein